MSKPLKTDVILLTELTIYSQPRQGFYTLNDSFRNFISFISNKMAEQNRVMLKKCEN